MKKLLTMFALGSTMMFASCSSNNNNSDKRLVTLDQQQTTQTVNTPSPCVIEVPVDDPALDAVSRKADEHKFYNFCDSTVTITGYSGGYGGPIFNKRPITELHGTEKAEMQAAYAKYQSYNHH